MGAVSIQQVGLSRVVSVALRIKDNGIHGAANGSQAVYRKYRCGTRSNKGYDQCTGPEIDAYTVDGILLDEVRRLFAPEQWEAVLEEVTNTQRRESTQRSQTMQRIKAQLKEKEAAIAQGTRNVLVLTDTGVIREVQTMLQTVQGERDRLAQALEEEQVLAAQESTEASSWQAAMETLRNDWATLVTTEAIDVADSSNAQDLRELFRLFFEKVVVRDDTLELTLRFPVLSAPEGKMSKKEHAPFSDAKRVFNVGAGRGTRTPTDCSIRPSNVSVCQFRHPDNDTVQ